MQTIRNIFNFAGLLVKQVLGHVHFSLPEAARTLSNPTSFGVPPQTRIVEERI